jgi:alkylmercury lyase
MPGDDLAPGAGPAESVGVDIAALARRFAAVFPHLDAREGALAVTLYRLLARGEPVPWARLAERTGRPEAELRPVVSGWPGVDEEAAGLTGFGGLSIRPVSGHELEVAGRTLYARCAWDTLFLPGLLGQPAQVRSICPQTGAPVRLRVEPQRVAALEPPGALLSLLEPRPGMTDDLTRHF